MTDDGRPVVLVVEDEPDVAETYEFWLADEYEVRRAESGDDALELVDDEVDVILLDRMMPGTPGDEVLREMRDRGIDCPVAMVSAVDPGFDVIEMGFDDYVAKPPRRDELLETVAELLERATYERDVRRLRTLIRKKALLEAEKSPEQLAANDAFGRLRDDIEALRAELQAESEPLADDVAFVSALRDLTDDEDA
ncbi:MAG: response regulator [Halobacteriaceae archaeon]